MPPFHESLRSVRFQGRIRNDRPEKRKQMDALHQDAVSVVEEDRHQRPERLICGCVGFSSTVIVIRLLSDRSVDKCHRSTNNTLGSNKCTIKVGQAGQKLHESTTENKKSNTSIQRYNY